MTRHSVIISDKAKGTIFENYDRQQVIIRRKNTFLIYFSMYYYEAVYLRIDNRVIGY